jgi:hypothetical protein
MGIIYFIPNPGNAGLLLGVLLSGRFCGMLRLLQVYGTVDKEKSKQQLLLEANAKRGLLATGIPLPFLLYLPAE